MMVSKYTVTIDLAKKHIECDYDKSVYRADVIKLCRHIEDLQVQVKTLTIPVVTNCKKSIGNKNIDEVINDKEALWERIDNKLTEELKQQKEGGKKFIADTDIDNLISKIIKEELT